MNAFTGCQYWDNVTRRHETETGETTVTQLTHPHHESALGWLALLRSDSVTQIHISAVSWTSVWPDSADEMDWWLTAKSHTWHHLTRKTRRNSLKRSSKLRRMGGRVGGIEKYNLVITRSTGSPGYSQLQVKLEMPPQTFYPDPVWAVGSAAG